MNTESGALLMNRRTVLLELLISSGVYSIRESSNAKEFAAGTRKLTLRELDIDSLSAMEICLYLIFYLIKNLC